MTLLHPLIQATFTRSRRAIRGDLTEGVLCILKVNFCQVHVASVCEPNSIKFISICMSYEVQLDLVYVN